MKKKVFISVIILFVLILLGISLFINKKEENVALVDNNTLHKLEEEDTRNVIDEDIYSNETTNNDFENKVIESTDVIETKSNNETISKDISNQKSEETNNNVKSKTNQDKSKTEVIENNKDVVEESKTEDKSIKIKTDQDSYTELEAGYAYGSQTVELPKEWNY